jgi:penicillin-insensitive murein endopeptidase
MKTLMMVFLFISFNALASEPVGYYNRGQLINGECLPAAGQGFEVLQLSIDVGHIFGTTEMIDMLEETASDMQHRYPGRDRMQIEDISAKNGGDIDPHGSHENGQDVDIQYFKANNQEFRPTNLEPYAPSMVKNGQVSSNFDVERNWEVMKSLHKHGNVQMIFIDQKLKNELIAYAKAKGEYNTNLKVINSLHHVENHQDHFHVRLNCPASAKSCHSTTVKGGGV